MQKIQVFIKFFLSIITIIGHNMRKRKVLKILALLILVVLIVGASCCIIFVKNAIDDVKDVELDNIQSMQTLCKVYDVNGNEFVESNTDTYVRLDEISPYVLSAFISIEDKDFYKHNGFNYKRIAAAVVRNVTSGKIVEGASTISQQLIKNKYLTNERTFDRKLKEAYLTVKLESQYSKDDIMEAYLNTIYFGNGAYGIADASYVYFGKTPSELDLNESCVLAGLVKSPANYSPFNDIDNSINRRNLVLSEMLEDGKIDIVTYNTEVTKDIILNPKSIKKDNSDLYYRNVIKEAEEILGLSKNEINSRKYKIYTYMDPVIQTHLSNVVSDDKYYHINEHGNIADSLSIVADNKSMSVSAIAGRSEYDLLDFKRQPASLIKPLLVYAPVFESGKYYPCSRILDEPITIDGYSPRNVGNKYHGYVSIRDAVAQSLNVPAVKICDDLGVDTCRSYADKLNLNFAEEDNGLAIALGGLTYGCNLKNILDGYSPFVSDGDYQNYRFINKIVDSDNCVVYNEKMTKTHIYDTSTTELMTKTLVYSSIYGTSKLLKNLPYNVASKTGTVNIKNTNYNSDAYCLAYTTEHTMVTWLGNYSMDKQHNLSGCNNGGTYATQMVKDMFELIYDNHYPDDFEYANVVELPIDAISLSRDNVVKLASNLPERFVTYEEFAIDKMPTVTSNILDVPISPTLKSITNTRSVVLSFDVCDYHTYDILRYCNGEKFVLKTVSGESGVFEYVDTSLLDNTKYKYCVIARSCTTNIEKASNVVEVVINRDYNDLLSNINGSSIW